MSTSGGGEGGAGEGEGGGGGGEGARLQHPRSFKLRFASQREPGRSYVSAVKPLGLPATVADKFYARPEPTAGEDEGARIRDMFERGPRERHAAPLTSAHECGWWAPAGEAVAARADPRLHHPLRDSPWLKARLQVLAADARLART